jgi:PAS domain S-box-containing protein
MSNRVVSMLGFKPEELIGHPEFWDSRVHPDDLRHYLAEVPHLWKDGQHAFEYRFLHKDGTYRWIREEAKVIRDAAGKPVEVIGYWTDVTELRQLEAELVKSQRFATIGETATMVGHDLRNPLQAITGIAYLAKKGLKSRKPAEKKTVEGLLESIDEQVLYMDKIVSDLHDYAQPLTPKFTETSLPDLVKTVLSTVRVPTTVRVSVETEKGSPNVLIDSYLMRRVLTNLVINAMQAMPKGGKLAIRASKKGETATVSVQDTGTGIPEEHMHKLFNPFFTTKAKGQGLGLAVCKRLVEAQGGEITVESKPGKGTTFTASIPQRKNVR